MIAPLIPPKHITPSQKKSTAGTVCVATVVIKLVSWENRIIKSEFFAVSFACGETK